MNLELQAVSHSFGEANVLKDIHLTIQSGEILSLVGPSGCGKSTLLRIIGGLLKPTQGLVLGAGAIAENSLNPFTYVFQHLALLPWRTVEANVSLALEHHPLTRNQRCAIINDVLSRTGLTTFAEKFPNQLSGGMQQRVAIARALSVRPAILLMDEPLSALDGNTKQMLVNDLVGLWKQDAFTAIYVTHNLEDAVRLGHRVAVMSPNPGRIEHTLDLDMPIRDRQNDAKYVTHAIKKLRRLTNHTG